jgi:hypothetical protein
MKQIAGVIGMLALIATLVGHTASARQNSNSISAASCEGLVAYAAAMLKAGTVWADAMKQERFFERDATTFSNPEWITFAEIYEALQTAIKQITPPPFAAGWHQTQVEAMGLRSSFARTVATNGLFAALAFSDQIDKSEAEVIKQRRQAEAACPAFAGFHRQWDLLDGHVDRVDATPVAGATPTQATPAS